jgi:hypothetical protein
MTVQTSHSLRVQRLCEQVQRPHMSHYSTSCKDPVTPISSGKRMVELFGHDNARLLENNAYGRVFHSHSAYSPGTHANHQALLRQSAFPLHRESDPRIYDRWNRMFIANNKRSLSHFHLSYQRKEPCANLRKAQCSRRTTCVFNMTSGKNRYCRPSIISRKRDWVAVVGGRIR